MGLHSSPDTPPATTASPGATTRTVTPPRARKRISG